MSTDTDGIERIPAGPQALARRPVRQNDNKRQTLEVADDVARLMFSCLQRATGAAASRALSAPPRVRPAY
jgi:hypothetical protein